MAAGAAMSQVSQVGRDAHPLRVAIIGAGPRGLSVCERLVALAGDSRGARRALEIHLIDPFPPGPGQVWRTDQDPSLLMNTTIGEQTVFPDTSCQVACDSTGPDMGTWYRAQGGTEDIDCTFGPRVLYGEYLAWAYQYVRSRAPDHVTVVHRPVRAVAIDEPADSHGADVDSAVQVVRLSDGAALPAHAVVLAVGHIPAERTDERAAWARFAESSRLTYLPPGLPAEAPLAELPAGERVIFRGFGLNYFDLQTMLTTGRGGRFVPRQAQDATGIPEEAIELEYLPSGREPMLAPSSRSGVPYRSKPITAEHPLADYRLRAFTPENVERLADERPARELPAHELSRLHFNDQLWPLILADLRAGWYSALAKSEPEAFAADPGQLLEALAEGVDRHLSRRSSAETQESAHRLGRLTSDSPAWSAIEREVLAAPARALDLHGFLRPMEGLHFDSRTRDSRTLDTLTLDARSRAGDGPAGGGPGAGPVGNEGTSGTAGSSLTAWMLDFLRADLAASCLGPELSPEKSLFAVLWAAREYLKELVAAGRIEESSFVSEVRGWFEGFVSSICDGPPPQRYAELIALTEAGLVEFVGPEVHITTSPADEPAAFEARSPAVDAPVSARVLVDASSPVNQVRYADDSLISGMLERRQLTAAVHRNVDGIVQPLSGLAVAGPAHHTVDALGQVHPHRYCLSIQLSAVQLGLAIAANPGKRAQSLIDAHRIAESILGLTDERFQCPPRA